jgi:hypothetical protein
MSDVPPIDELQLLEPPVSHYRARRFISDPDVLEYLDSLILLTTKRIIRGKQSTEEPAEESTNG